jgi:hypothetical protein
MRTGTDRCGERSNLPTASWNECLWSIAWPARRQMVYQKGGSALSFDSGAREPALGGFGLPGAARMADSFGTIYGNTFFGSGRR